MKRRASTSSVIALVASLVLHGFLFAWLSRLPPARLRLVAPAQIELTWVDVEPPPPVPPVPEPEPVKSPVPKVKAQAPVAVPPKPVATIAPTPPAPDSPPKVSDTPKNDLPRLSTLTTLTLSPGSSFAMSLDAGVILPDEPRGLRGTEIAKDLVSDTARDTIGRGKVDRGLVHPYYSQLGKALMKSWDVDRVLTQGGIKAYTKQLGENFKMMNEIYGARANEYGKTGNPLGDVQLPEQRTGPLNDRAGGINPADFAARKEVTRKLYKAYESTKRATIRVVQDPTGKLLRVELVEPSNDSVVDREAMVDVRKAAKQLPPPPPEVVGTRTELASLWTFELVISITPPIPTFTFEFDEVSGFIDPRLPLDRRIYKKVRLVSIE